MMDELKHRALTDSFFSSKQTLQQKPQLRDDFQEDEACVTTHFVFFFPFIKIIQRGKRCFPLRDWTTFSVFLLQTAGFVFRWESVIGDASLSLHMKAQAFC